MLGIFSRKKKLYPEQIEAIETEINCRLVANGQRDSGKFITSFREMYTFHKIIKLLEKHQELTVTDSMLQNTGSKDLEEFKLKLYHFYNEIQMIEKLDLIEECHFNKYQIKACILSDKGLRLDNISFTQQC